MKKVVLFYVGFFLLLSGCTTEYVTPVRTQRVYSSNDRYKYSSDHKRKRHRHRHDREEDRYYYEDDDGYGRRGGFCPPGQAKKGNC